MLQFKKTILPYLFIIQKFFHCLVQNLKCDIFEIIDTDSILLNSSCKCRILLQRIKEKCGVDPDGEFTMSVILRDTWPFTNGTLTLQ